VLLCLCLADSFRKSIPGSRASVRERAHLCYRPMFDVACSEGAGNNRPKSRTMYFQRTCLVSIFHSDNAWSVNDMHSTVKHFNQWAQFKFQIIDFTSTGFTFAFCNSPSCFHFSDRPLSSRLQSGYTSAGSLVNKWWNKPRRCSVCQERKTRSAAVVVIADRTTCNSTMG